MIHESADIKSASVATLRSAFEYSGQKCSAASRLYVCESKWPEMRAHMISLLGELEIGSPLDFKTFTSSVIDERSFDKIKSYIDYGLSKKSDLKLVYGGKCDKSKGYFIQPTIFETTNPHDILMREVFLKA